MESNILLMSDKLKYTNKMVQIWKNRIFGAPSHSVQEMISWPARWREERSHEQEQRSTEKLLTFTT